MSEEEKASEFGAMHDALIDHMKPELHELAINEGGKSIAVLVAPEKHKVHNLQVWLDPLREHPRRAKGTSAHLTFESFVAHASLHGAAERSAVFVDVSASTPKVVAVYDYNAPGSPGWGAHRASLELPFSEEFVAWRNAAARSHSQGEFAEFLETHLLDVLDPSLVAKSAPSAAAVADSLGITYATQAALLGLSRSLNVRVDTKVEQSQNLASGEGTLHFEESHTTKSDGQVVKVPGGFCLAISVFRGDDQKCVIPVRLRYRVKDGRVSWTLHLHRIDEVLRLEVEALVKRLADATHLPTYAGTPEPAAS